mmetsp:Transcript_31726/g.64816  ORF Transcript_31726/g.64816 Transcript_31726/m.64816 type:complete len:102 (+) Transcript_31726:1628-1933(+)
MNFLFFSRYPSGQYFCPLNCPFAIGNLVASIELSIMPNRIKKGREYMPLEKMSFLRRWDASLCPEAQDGVALAQIILYRLTGVNFATSHLIRKDQNPEILD